MDKIKRFIECLLPVTACNLKCEYCYMIQEGRCSGEIPKLKYSSQYIAKALSKERMGGVCYVSICGAGETLLPKYSIDIVHELLKQGHYVNVTNNGTMTERFTDICHWDGDLLKRLHFAFSFHYLELKKRNLIDVFFSNVNMVRRVGCSFVVQFNLYDGYIPYLDEIKRLCIDNVGALPQVAATRDESCITEYKLMTNHGEADYIEFGRQFNSPLFEFTMKNFMVKRREYCYAGDWGFKLNLNTGDMTPCCSNGDIKFNLFSDIEKSIPFNAIGRNCPNLFCINSSHFMSLGIIPSIDCPTYAELRNRESGNWYSPEMKMFLNSKLYESN